MNNSNSRYQGRPLVRLLECYVLWSIGQLSSTEARGLEAMTPKLQSVYGVEGDWPTVIATVMEFPPNMPELVRGGWVKNLEIAARNRVVLTPQHFAELFVDQNFLD